MTKKVNTGLTGAETSLAVALLNAGVKPASEEAGDPAVAPATPTPVASATPTSADAAITASAQIDSEIADAKRVWEHARAGGITRQQFEYMCSSDPAKEAFLKQHKKAIFGSKKQRLEEAAAAVIAAGVSKPSDITRSKSKSKSTKPHVSLPRSDVSRMLDVLLKQHKQINAKK